MTSRSILLALVLGVSGTAAYGAEPGQSACGRRQVDITPNLDWGLMNAWGTKFTGVHDPIYVRAIVVDNGTSSAVIVAIDTSGNEVVKDMVEGIAKATGIPGKNVILAATHDHNSPRIGQSAPRQRGNNPAPTPAPGGAAWTAKVISAVVDAVSQAKAGLQPAVMAFEPGPWT